MLPPAEYSHQPQKMKSAFHMRWVAAAIVALTIALVSTYAGAWFPHGTISSVGTTFTISPSIDGGASGGGTFSAGSMQTVVATPNGGFSFVNWTVGGSPVSTSASYTFTLTANITLVANFISSGGSSTITVAALPSADGAVSGGGTFTTSSMQTVTATPTSGSYSFVNWTDTSIPTSVTDGTGAVWSFGPTAVSDL
jgi:hypothetical protein